MRGCSASPLDIVIGSRYVPGGRIADDWSKARQKISRFATRLSHLVLKADVSDPMSGFFMMRREAFDREMRALSQQGFKILLDLFASSPAPLRFAELPFEFRPRIHGQSKLDVLVAWEYVFLILDKLVGRFVPVRFVSFAAIGLLGVGVHVAVLGWALSLGLEFVVAQTAATTVAMFSNYALNNQLTYRDRRLRGGQFLLGFLTFAAVCSVGMIANVGVGTLLFRGEHLSWWMAGVAGALVGAVFNYSATSFFTWHRRPS
jgi:dolichol-phosphate mannosyltransferase